MSMLKSIKSGVIVHDSNSCTGCGVCEVMCSLYHEGVLGPTLARAHIIRQPFTGEHEHNICRQCFSPSCYFACPLPDKAICIDGTNGTIYIDEDECIGCGTCIDACPFDPPRIKINTEKNVAFKCDLCKGREGGPICVYYCPSQSLKLVSGNER